jgi:hypothetical protein
MTPEAKIPTVFISSTFVDDYGGERLPVPLRKQIIERRHELPVRIWAYEHNYRGLNDGPDADTIIDRCFAGIESCDLFVFLLTGRHGTGAGYGGAIAQASYLELELFAAAMLRKPIIVLQEHGRPADDALQAALEMLRRSLGTRRYFVGYDAALFARFVEACEALARTGEPEGRGPSGLADWLSLRRSREDPAADLDSPGVVFLGGTQMTADRSGDLDLAQAMLDEVSTGIRNKMGHVDMIPHGAALFRIWTAMRELSGHSVRSPQVATLWNKAYGLWAGKASWFGLHGHTFMGPYAALNSQVLLRRAFEGDAEFAGGHELRESFGARASALYSIAQKVVRWERKLFHYDQAMIAANRALASDAGARQGVLSIRGHALMRSGMLARPWRFWEAAADLKASLDLRIANGAAAASIGEARVDYGFCMMLTGRIFAGIAEMQAGVVLLRSDTSVDGLSFLGRGLRKLEQGALLVGRRSLALAARAEREAVIAKTQAMDQARKLPISFG